MKRHSPQPPPWQRPSRIVWLILAVAGSCWLIQHMPAESHRMKAASGLLSSHHAASAKSSTLDTPGNGPEGGKSWQRIQQRSDSEQIFLKLRTFTSLFATVGIAAFLGALMEARRWRLGLAKITGRLTRMARLPEIVGVAMPAALFSSAAANSLLVSSHAQGRIRTSALIAGGMANSHLAYIADSLRVLYPVIAVIGLPGIWYFGIQFAGGFGVLLGVLLWNRWYVSGHGNMPDAGEASEAEAGPKVSPLPWRDAVSKAAIRALSLLFRMLYLTLPLMLGIEWLLKSGAFTFWENALPPKVVAHFPAELLSVAAAQMGGLVQSSVVAAGLKAGGLLNNTQILLAMLVGNAVGNPIRMLRRNLPSALGIFPVPIALTVVLGMQFSRFLITLFAIAAVMVYAN